MEALLPAHKHLREFLEELHRLQQQIVEVQGVVLPELLLIGLIEPGHVPLVIVHRLVPVGLPVPHLVLGCGDSGKDRPLPVHLRIHGQVLDHLLHKGPLVVRVIYGKVPAIAQALDVPPQDPDAHGMKGGDEHICPRSPQHGVHTFPHLSGRLVGEGDGQDLPGHDPLIDQVGDPVGQDPGLSGAGSRQHQKGPLRMLHGLPLSVIQFHQHRIHLSASFPKFSPNSIAENEKTCHIVSNTV